MDGECFCPPGYVGEACESVCKPGTYGLSCGDTCQCETGHVCHHITGDCLRCQSGYYGDGCSQTCNCSLAGTALCSHIDGKCFCLGNYFGESCQLHCPFGFDKLHGCLETIQVQS